MPRVAGNTIFTVKVGPRCFRKKFRCQYAGALDESSHLVRPQYFFSPDQEADGVRTDGRRPQRPRCMLGLHRTREHQNFVSFPRLLSGVEVSAMRFEMLQDGPQQTLRNLGPDVRPSYGRIGQSVQIETCPVRSARTDMDFFKKFVPYFEESHPRRRLQGT